MENINFHYIFEEYSAICRIHSNFHFRRRVCLLFVFTPPTKIVIINSLTHSYVQQFDSFLNGNGNNSMTRFLKTVSWCHLLMNTLFITIIVYYLFVLKSQWMAPFYCCFFSSSCRLFFHCYSRPAVWADSLLCFQWTRKKDHNVSFQVWLHSQLQSMEQIHFYQMNMEKSFSIVEKSWTDFFSRYLSQWFLRNKT